MRSRLAPLPRRDPGTRERLLATAARVFADHGYAATTIRDVCKRARANVAAVNYHFGSKEQLYVETLRWAMTLCQGEDTAELLTFAARDDLSRAERLVGTIRRFALGMLAARPSWHQHLMFREMTSPTLALDRIVDEFLEPRFDALRRAVAPYVGEGDRRTVDLHVMSIIGQLLYHKLAGAVALRLLKEPSYGPALAGRIVDHVAAFTLRSLEGRRRRERRKKGRPD
jgi:AcrR family transcriptional regulator